jgi:AcrR family transcriptional regulator
VANATRSDQRSARQQELIEVASRLFAVRGYHSVGINDISGELGLTGPAFYRHYPSKEALLVAVLEDAITSHLEEVGDLAASVRDPRESLEAIVRHHLGFVFSHAAEITTWRTEFRSLPEGDRLRLRHLQRLYVEEWVRTFRQLRPGVTADEARTMCHASIALLQSPTEHHSTLAPAEIAPLLFDMALHALLGDSRSSGRYDAAH